MRKEAKPCDQNHFDQLAMRERCNVLRMNAATEDCGFVYGGIVKRNGLLKVGMSWGCPLCRMDGQRLLYRGIAWSEDALHHEKQVLWSLGMPLIGREHFDDAEGRLKFLFEQGLLNDYWEKSMELEIEIAMKIG